MVTIPGRRNPRTRFRLRTVMGGVVGAIIIVWTAVPLYNILAMAVSPPNVRFGRSLVPESISVQSFMAVVKQTDHYTSHFWSQTFSSVFVAVAVVVIVLFVGSLTSFAIDKLRPRWGNALLVAGLASYAIPLAFLAVPLYKVMSIYGLLGSRWALILTMVMFTLPYTIWIFTQFSRMSIPTDIDESASVDGAGPWRRYALIYLPMMKPALLAIGGYAFLASWNEYLMAFLLLSRQDHMTLPVSIASFLSTDQVQWNIMMAMSLIYAVPPIIAYIFFRKSMVGGLSMGSAKG